jgi:hypothetical protein
MEPQSLDFSSATAGCGVVGNIAKHSAKCPAMTKWQAVFLPIGLKIWAAF